MRMMISAAITLLSLSPALADGPFTHTPGVDRFGYYFIEGAPFSNGLQFDYFHIGFEFDAWEKGERIETYAPVMAEFSELAPAVGQMTPDKKYPEVTFRVLPTTYTITNNEVQFVGEHPRVGTVTVDAKFNADGVLQGDIAYGEQSLKDQTFVFFGGD